MAPSCPRCELALLERKHGKLRLLACPTEHGALLPHGSRPALTFAARAALDEAIERPRGKGLACGSCGAQTHAVVAARHADLIDLDACVACRAVWFDAGERERLEARAPRGKAESPMVSSTLGLQGSGEVANALFSNAGSLVEFAFALFDGW